MTDGGSSGPSSDTTGDSSLDAVADAAGEHATEAFSILANETRLSILLALWEASEPFGDDDALAFEPLGERVGVEDEGQFGYHLQKLTGTFVRETDGGYELRRSGERLVRTVVAGVGIRDPAFERSEIDDTCPYCDAPVAVTYEDEWLFAVCTNCEGSYGDRDDRPDGMLSGVVMDPTGLTDRSPQEAWQSAWQKTHGILQIATEGICDTCSGPMEQSLDVCDDHAADGVCDECGHRWQVNARFTCPVCKNHHNGPPRTIVANHPAVVSFYQERGVPFQYETDDPEVSKRKGELLQNHEQELVSEDPLRVLVTVPFEGDELHLTLDEDLDVVDVDEPD